jgi:hypothetical protein
MVKAIILAINNTPQKSYRIAQFDSFSLSSSFFDPSATRVDTLRQQSQLQHRNHAKSGGAFLCITVRKVFIAAQE